MLFLWWDKNICRGGAQVVGVMSRDGAGAVGLISADGHVGVVGVVGAVETLAVGVGHRAVLSDRTGSLVVVRLKNLL